MNNDSYLLCTLQSIHKFEATLIEEESYLFQQEYFRQKFLHYCYQYPGYSYEEITSLVNNFTLFCSKVRDLKTKNKYSSNIPIGVFRYMLLHDMSWSEYYTVRRKPGYVVEGAYWSNGMFYQVREDKKSDFEVYQVTLMIDPLTQKIHSFPARETSADEDIFTQNQ